METLGNSVLFEKAPIYLGIGCFFQNNHAEVRPRNPWSPQNFIKRHTIDLAGPGQFSIKSPNCCTHEDGWDTLGRVNCLPSFGPGFRMIGTIPSHHNRSYSVLQSKEGCFKVFLPQYICVFRRNCFINAIFFS